MTPIVDHTDVRRRARHTETRWILLEQVLWECNVRIVYLAAGQPDPIAVRLLGALSSPMSVEQIDAATFARCASEEEVVVRHRVLLELLRALYRAGVVQWSESDGLVQRVPAVRFDFSEAAVETMSIRLWGVRPAGEVFVDIKGRCASIGSVAKRMREHGVPIARYEDSSVKAVDEWIRGSWAAHRQIKSLCREQCVGPRQETLQRSGLVEPSTRILAVQPSSLMVSGGLVRLYRCYFFRTVGGWRAQVRNYPRGGIVPHFTDALRSNAEMAATLAENAVALSGDAR